MKGLSSSEASARLAKDGYNELPSSQPKSIWTIVLEVIKEPMFLLLISCGVLYMIVGDYKEGGILLSTILIIIFITFYQYQKTEKALEALKKLSSPRALVIRDGKEIRIAGREVVMDDLLILNEGDRVPADADVIDSVNLTIDESILTGESIAVTKEAAKENNDTYSKVFSGTLVVQGKGIARVTATGVHTQFGKIGVSLQGIEEDSTRLQKEMKVLIRNLFIIGAFISVAVVLAFYFTRGNFIQSLLTGLSAAMAILPEEFPVVLTIFLALGSWRLSKIHVLTRKPSAIETLGSATVLCSDKTGTITQNKMEVAALYLNGESIPKKEFQSKKETISAFVTTAFYASQKDTIDPMEKAIVQVYTSLSTNSALPVLVKEYPLSKTLFAMTRVLKDEQGVLSVSCKGAPEAIFDLCKMTQEQKNEQLLQVNKMAADGFRVIAMATANSQDVVLPDTQQGFNYSYLGLIGFEDPIREEVPAAIKECQEAGIKVIMITGDFPATAKCIAKQIGLSNVEDVMTGDQLKELSDEELRKKITHISIFARVVPEQKLRLVQALKANNEIVAMTGDGVNDAPALKAAHIGIAMGNKGTDVAREASSLVLLDDNFASIVAAIRSGRKIFDNLQKAMSYIIAIHIPIIGLALIPAFWSSFPLLLMPLHIVFMELIIDPISSIAFESEQEERNIMKRKPRDINEQFFGSKKILGSVMQGVLLLGMVITVYFLSVNEGHSDGEVRAIAFSSLIIGNVFLVLTNLSRTRNFVQVFLERNIATLIILLGALLVLFLVISIPALQKVFSFEFPGYAHFVSSLTGAALILLLLELIKYFRYRR